MRAASPYLFIFFYFLLTSGTSNAAQCLPHLGNGNICTAKDFTLTETVINGPVSCTEGETIPQPITIRVGIEPTANERYDIGFFIGENGESAIEGESCTFSSLYPIESGSNFNGDSGSGPYRNLDANQCGDTLKTDGPVYRDIVLNNVLCVDSDNNGELDIDYALTWQNLARSCPDPLEEANFFPPSSSKCKAAIGNLSDIVVLPPLIQPSIKITKHASPNMIAEPGGDISYSLEIENNGSQVVTLTSLIDNVFGDVTDIAVGASSCSVPQELEPLEAYSCSFKQIINGIAPGTHINTVTATAANNQGTIITASDNAVVIFIAAGQPSGSIGNLIWNDLNADGFHTSDEPGISNVAVNLFQDNSTGYIFISTTNTVENGYYEFHELPAGTYRVIPDISNPPLNHMVHTGGTSPHDNIILEDHEHYMDADFGYSQAEITVTKTPDRNVVSAPTAPVTYTVNINNSAALDVTLTQLTDTIFGNLSLKGCILPQSLPAGGQYSCQFTETITGNSGDEHNNTATALAFDVDQNEVHASDSARVLFTDNSNGAISGFVWNDLNNNAVHDPWEPYFDDVTISLSGTASATTITQYGGHYEFNLLGAGSYTVTITDSSNILSKHVLTTANEPYSKNLSAGEIDSNINFGYVKAAIDISKTANKNIIISGSDVDFTLLINNTGAVDLDITHLADSKFGILDTECGLPVIITAGNNFTCSFTETIIGSDIHHNVVIMTAQDSDSHTFLASDYENIVIVSGGAIGDLVWFDSNGNGSKDVNEPGIEGITLDLIHNAQVISSTITNSDGHYVFPVTNGTYNINVTDTAHILDNAVLSGGINPHTNIVISNDINHTIDFGYTLPVLPPVNPHINVTKTGSTSTINTSELVTFSINIHNSGPVNVILTELIDTVFGSLDGKGSCSTGGTIPQAGDYTCSFSQVLTGAYGNIHHNIVFAITKDAADNIALGADDWRITFESTQKIPVFSFPGLILVIISLLLIAIRRNRTIK